MKHGAVAFYCFDFCKEYDKIDCSDISSKLSSYSRTEHVRPLVWWWCLK